MRKWLTASAIGFAGFVIGAGVVLAGIYYRADLLAASQHLAPLAPLVEGLVETRAPGDPRSASNGLKTTKFTLRSDNLLQEILRLPNDFDQTLTLYSLLQDADGDDLERLLDEARLLRPADEGRAAASILYSRYAALDPEAAVQRIVNSGPFDQRYLYGIFVTWAKYDVDAAMAHAEELPPELRQQAGRGILSGSAQLPGQRRQEIADQFSLQRQLDWMDTRELIDEEPAAAWQRALSSQNLDTGLLAEVGRAWAQRDPVSALNAVAAVRDTAFRDAFSEQLIAQWASTDPEAARHWGLSQLDSQTRLPLLRGVAAGIARNNTDEALNFVLGLDGRERQEAAKVVFARWAKTDPAGAADTLTMLDDGAMFAAASGNIILEWVKTDAYAAFEWLGSQDVDSRSSASRQWQVLHALRQIARSDPETALELASGLPGQGRQNAMSTAMGIWAKNDPRGAASWLEGAADVDRQAYGSLAAAVVEGLAADDPEAAFRWAWGQPVETQMSAMPALAAFVSERSLNEAARLVSRIGDADVREAAAKTLAWTWGREHPEEAVRWITREVPARERKPLLRNVFFVWARNDRDDAIAAMRRLKRSDRDTAAVTIVHNALEDAPDVAERVYKDIRDDSVRKEAAMSLYWHFHGKDDDARAERYAEDADMGSEQFVHERMVVEGHL